ncbi:RICIN domain-containing protein [Streptomyces sp. NPDC059063]|uniref:RICIN domain-containing protein n=1 Tax=unclassified Streptomyces TaxID=2593676 RepID=UPI00368F3699
MTPHHRLAVLSTALAAVALAVAAPGVDAAESHAPAKSRASAESRAPADAAAPRGTRAIGPFQVRNQGVGRCMGFPRGDDRMRVWNCTTEAYQLWDLVADGNGAYHMVTRGDGRCLAGWAQGPNRWATWLSDCDRSFTNVDQLWYVHPVHSADPAPISNLFGRVLEPDRGWGGVNETPVVIYDNEGLPNQQWTLKYAP